MRRRVNQNDLNKIANPKKFSNPKSETLVSLENQKVSAVGMTALNAHAHSRAGETPSDSFSERVGRSRGCSGGLTNADCVSRNHDRVGSIGSRDYSTQGARRLAHLGRKSLGRAGGRNAAEPVPHYAFGVTAGGAPSLVQSIWKSTRLVTRLPTVSQSVSERVTSKIGERRETHQNKILKAGEKTKTSLPGSPPPAPNERCRWWGTREGGRQKQYIK